MKLIKPSFEILVQNIPETEKAKTVSSHVKNREDFIDLYMQNMFKHIERVGRICYKSEDKITDTSAEEFVKRMIASKHYAMLEHGTVYLHVFTSDLHDGGFDLEKYFINKFSKVVSMKRDDHLEYLITTNYRVIVENKWASDLKYLRNPYASYYCDETGKSCFDLRHSVLFHTNRQVTHELVRHRVMSFAQESTRYCNYTKGKFGNEITFIVPNWLYDECNFNEHGELEGLKQGRKEETVLYMQTLQKIEETYFAMINSGMKPQQAANILPNATKADIVMTGAQSDLVHFFDLRALGKTGAPHPQMLELAKPLYDHFKQAQYVD